ncbi:MAG: iron ABC transporter substrate-binding protein [Balneolales bacterium]
MMRSQSIITFVAFTFFVCLPLVLPAQSLTIYSGRSKALVEPLIQRFEDETGITVRVRYGGTTQLAMALLEEGDRSPADLFWAQDAGALGAVNAENLFEDLPQSTLETLPPQYRGQDGKWIATSGRARVLAYSTSRVDKAQLPKSVFDLDAPQWEDRIGWAPGNGSFQSFLTAMRKINGDAQTLEWLQEIKNSGVENYSNNTSIVQAIAAGEIDMGLVNHYYLYRFLENDPDFPVDQIFFEAGDVGNLVNVSGIGLLNSAANKDTAIQFIDFLLSTPSQEYFTEEVYEYPVIPDLRGSLRHENPAGLSPDVDLEELGDLDGTLDMLREAGLL